MPEGVPTTAGATRRQTLAPVPFEGEGGLFFQTWYPICLSEDVASGQVIGRDFLDGRVIVIRGEDGIVRVQSAYCPHVGADLSVGKVVGNNVQCAFHHWEYDHTGVCVKTGIGDAPPRVACLYTFPAQERWGIVWAFNGDTPCWSLPEFDVPPERQLVRNLVSEEYTCDGWIFSCNTPDMQHIKVVHGIRFNHDDPHRLVDWREDGFDYNISAGHQGGVPIEWRVGIRASSFFWQRGTYDGWWFGAVSGFSCPRPGHHSVFLAIVTDKADPNAAEHAEEAAALLARTVAEDRDILNTIHYRPGTLTKGDETLARYLTMLRGWPRAHPSAPFIR